LHRNDTIFDVALVYQLLCGSAVGIWDCFVACVRTFIAKERRPMTPSQFQTRILDQACELFPFHETAESEALILAIAGVESGWTERRQIGGTARGWWQFERAGGLRGVMRHPASVAPLQEFCASMALPWDEVALFEALAWHDGLAYACARLLLYTDLAVLPALGDVDGASEYYRRLWRPGKYDPVRFATCYAEGQGIA
jgi:hypothetical protein